MEREEMRTEVDAFGPVEIPCSRLYGAQTARSLENFPIGTETVPTPVIHALGLIKQSAAQVNKAQGRLGPDLADAIIKAAKEVAAGRHDREFPLVVWQTGSGTQTNMNANEVIANRANEMLGGVRGAKEPVHPNDHVNLSQSSNDTFPTAMHIAAVAEIKSRLLKSLHELQAALVSKAEEYSSIVKIGRTHLQDAVPLTVGQEFSGYAAQVAFGIKNVEDCLSGLCELAQGGTAVGTGLNTLEGFDRLFAETVAEISGFPFRPAANKFAAIAAHDAVVNAHAALNGLASALFKIANDIRLLGSGPRTGFGELELPQNEAGSSIMPGKVNPTQCEAMTMVCTQVMGNHTTISIANSQGHLELNAFKPLIAYTLHQSIDLLSDATGSFTKRCVIGLTVNRDRVHYLLERSLMLVTALAGNIGYDKASKIAKTAHEKNISLRAAAIDSGFVSAEEFDAAVVPGDMVRPKS